MSITTWDIETTTHSSFKRKANPFDSRNWTVVHGWKRKDQQVEHYRFGDDRPKPGWLKPLLVGTKLLVGMNIKFDLLHALQDPENLDAWMEYVANGGNVWDIQLAEYLLCGMGQPNQMLSLDEIAPRYGGNVKIDEVKALWAAGVQTNEIDPELLKRYLVGGDDENGDFQLGDVENTERVAMAQIARARDVGQVNSVMLNMGSLLCTIEMERNGMFVNRPLALELAAALKVEVDKLKEELDKYLPADLPFEFNWSSRFHKSALIFGGSVKYERREYMLKGDLGYTFEAGHPQQAFAQREVEVQCVDDDGFPIYYKSGKNAGEPKTKKVKVDDKTKPKSRMSEDYYTFPRITDPKPEWESADPGVYSVSEDVIETLGDRGIPFLKALAQLAKMSKDLGTYYITTNEETGEQKGMLTLVDEHGIIHHSINHTSTVTGRFSSSNPNLQNIPKGNKSDIKKVFQSRFGEEGVVIQSDFTALEIYLQAILTKCKQLILDLKAGLDMHCLRLASKEGMPYEEVYELCKGENATQEWDYKRTDAKVYSFQAAYGAGDAKIAESTGMAIETVAAFRAADEERYPEITQYFDKRTQEIKANRRPTGKVIPHPFVRGVMCPIGRSTVRTPDGKLYAYQESPSPEYLVKRGTFSSFSPTEIKNYEVQGEGGEWAKAAMWLAVREFYRNKNWGGKGLLVNQVHDANYADAHNTVKFEVAAHLHACMEAASDLMEFLFKWTVPVPVPSDTTWGASMKDEAKIPGVTERAAEIRIDLRKRYMAGYRPSFVQ